MCVINLDKLKTLRKEKRLTQERLAFKIGVSVDEIGKLERNEINDPHISVIIKLANFYKVSVDWLLDRENISYVDKFESKVIRFIREKILNRRIMELTIEHYENPTELTGILKQIYLLVPLMDLETARSILRLLTHKIDL